MPSLATHQERLDFWGRHRNVGVALGVVLPVLGILHAVTDPEQTYRTAVVVINAVVIGLSLALLLVPLERMLRGPRGELVFELWELAGLGIVTLVAALDGGGRSPYVTSYYVLLAHAALAFPPVTVALAGGVATASYVGLAAAGGGVPSDLVYVAGTLAVTTITCAAASSSHGRAYRQKAHDAQRAQALAEQDSMTGCLNHRAFGGRLAEAAAAAHDSSPVSVLFLDVDDFKAVNDTLGHAAGDEVIRALGHALRDVSRASDAAGRVGGDEFALLMPGTDLTGARAVAERLREHLARLPHRVTVSVGLATTATPSEGADLIASADRAAYRAKRAGKDAVVVADG